MLKTLPKIVALTVLAVAWDSLHAQCTCPCPAPNCLDTLLLQPGPGSAQDCEISFARDGSGGSWGGYNMGATPCFGVGTYDWATVCRCLIRFNLPAGIRPELVQTVRLILFTNYWTRKDTALPFPIEVHALLRDWKSGSGSGGCTDKVPNSATVDGATAFDRFWGAQDGSQRWNKTGIGLDNTDAASEPSARVAKPSTDMSPWEFDITNLAKRWMSGNLPNHGVLLRNPLEFGVRNKNLHYPNFWTAENLQYPEQRPLLMIVYGRDAGPTEKPPAAGVATMVIQPGPGRAQDCQVQFGRPGTEGSWGNYNNGQTSCAAVGTYDWNTVMRTLIRFDMPRDIKPRRVESAKIVMSVKEWQTKDTSGDFPIEVYRVLREWKSGSGSGGCTDKERNSARIDGATGLERFWGRQNGEEDWNKAGVGLDDVDAIRVPATATSHAYGDVSPWDFDVTRLVRRWLNNEIPNFGVLLRTPYEFGVNEKNFHYPNFWTGENAERPGLRPKLVIVYKVDDDATAIPGIGTDRQRAKSRTVMAGRASVLLAGWDGAVQVCVYDAQGRLVHHEQVQDPAVAATVDLSRLPEGQYACSVAGQEGSRVTRMVRVSR